MAITGTLTINLGISRLDGTRLMKGALNNGGFGRATTFLRQDRQLKNNDTIWVDGEDDEFKGPVIVITDAGRADEESLAFGASSKGIAASAGIAAASGGKKAGAKGASKRKGGGQKSSKKPGAKKSGSKTTTAKRGGKPSKRSAKKSSK
jgi:hypothetical protein